MTGFRHTIEWFIDRDTIVGNLRCFAPAGSPCRTTCKQGCESWPCDIDGHTLGDYGQCCAVEWIDNEGAIEECYAGKDKRPLQDGPVHVNWNGSYWEWSYPAVRP